jgi:ATP:cob(I)alamin adenosyltransferase
LLRGGAGCCGLKYYTRTGDTGYTASFDGTVLPKYHPCIHFFGDIDEVLSILGEILSLEKDELILYVYNAVKSVAGTAYQRKSPTIDIREVEHLIDENYVELHGFLEYYLPGDTVYSKISMARAALRRAERFYWECVMLEGYINHRWAKTTGALLNRLSDLLFAIQAKRYVMNCTPRTTD